MPPPYGAKWLKFWLNSESTLRQQITEKKEKELRIAERKKLKAEKEEEKLKKQMEKSEMNGKKGSRVRRKLMSVPMKNPMTNPMKIPVKFHMHLLPKLKYFQKTKSLKNNCKTRLIKTFNHWPETSF